MVQQLTAFINNSPFLFYLVCINLVSVIVCISDKLRAKRHSRRISEKTLFALCIIGGSVCMYITMRLIRHKTLHKKFMIGIPIIICVQAVLLLIIFKSLA